MIDDKKIEAAANKHIETEYARYNSGEVEEEMICLRGKDSFKAGANWMQEEFLKNLWHPASEEPDVRHKTIICLYEDGHICQDYDVTTMKFEISPKLPNYERFNGLSEKYYGKK